MTNFLGAQLLQSGNLKHKFSQKHFCWVFVSHYRKRFHELNFQGMMKKTPLPSLISRLHLPNDESLGTFFHNILGSANGQSHIFEVHIIRRVDFQYCTRCKKRPTDLVFLLQLCKSSLFPLSLPPNFTSFAHEFLLFHCLHPLLLFLPLKPSHLSLASCHLLLLILKKLAAFLFSLLLNWLHSFVFHYSFLQRL